MGSWSSYGIGSAKKDLPAFVLLMTGVDQPIIPFQIQAAVTACTEQVGQYFAPPRGMGW